MPFLWGTLISSVDLVSWLSWHFNEMRHSVWHKQLGPSFSPILAEAGALLLVDTYMVGTLEALHKQATGLDAWASRVKCPARFVSHLHEICIYVWVVYSLCFFCCLFITVNWWYVWCFEWASGNQEEVQACLVTLWLFIISCYSLYKTTLGLLCSWFENNPHFHKYSMDFHV